MSVIVDVHEAGQPDVAARPTLPALLQRAVVGFWYEVARALVAGLAALPCAAPPVVAVLAGAPFLLVGLTCLPLALLGTGIAAFAARVARGEKATLRDLSRVDPTLALVGTLLATVAGACLAAPGAAPLAGVALGAVLLLVAPVTLAYGAVRARRGPAAIRGGLILVAYRPSWALSLLALTCLGGFAIAASAGVLILVVPALGAVIGCALVGRMLRDIDDAQGAA